MSTVATVTPTHGLTSSFEVDGISTGVTVQLGDDGKDGVARLVFESWADGLEAPPRVTEVHLRRKTFHALHVAMQSMILTPDKWELPPQPVKETP